MYLQCVSTNKSIRDRVGGWTEREEYVLTYISTNPLMSYGPNKYIVLDHLLQSLHSFCWWPFVQALVNLLSPVSPLEQTETSSTWPTLRWVVLLYIATSCAWHCDARFEHKEDCSKLRRHVNTGSTMLPSGLTHCVNLGEKKEGIINVSSLWCTVHDTKNLTFSEWIP